MSRVCVVLQVRGGCMAGSCILLLWIAESKEHDGADLLQPKS
jgi:hypothetical protein